MHDDVPAVPVRPGGGRGRNPDAPLNPVPQRLLEKWMVEAGLAVRRVGRDARADAAGHAIGGALDRLG